MAYKSKSKGKKPSYDSSESDVMTSEEEDMTWIQWFCSLKGNEFFCEVEEDYIQDDFNLTGLRPLVPNYDYALDLILDADTDDDLTDEQQEIIETAAEYLYGLIHAWYILTARGMLSMVEKFQNVDFGRCPRVLCKGQPVLPVGITDLPRTNTVKIFCPSCQDMYYPRLRRHSNIDGCYFGTTFSHLVLHTYPELQPPLTSEKYVPKIYGFKIHRTAESAIQTQAAGSKSENSTTNKVA